MSVCLFVHGMVGYFFTKLYHAMVILEYEVIDNQ